MTNKGVVTAVNGDTLTVAFERHEACGDCHACMHGSENCAKHTVSLKGRAQVGDIIVMTGGRIGKDGTPGADFPLPLAGFIVGLAAGWGLTKTGVKMNGELLMALCAVIGTAAAYFIMRAIDPKLSKGRWEQKIISVTHPEETENKQA